MSKVSYWDHISKVNIGIRVLQIASVQAGLIRVRTGKLFSYFSTKTGERSGRVLDSRPRGRWFEPHRRHCLVSLSKNINPSSVLVQPRKICLFITDRLLMGLKESNQTKINQNVCCGCSKESIIETVL